MKKEKKTIFDLRNSAACLLSLALKQRFPSALLLPGKVTPLGFYCDFSFSGLFDDQCLRQVEEVMQSWIRQKMDVQIREMVAMSAKEYFSFHKEPFLAKHVESFSSSSTFPLMQIAGHMVLSESSSAFPDLGEIGAFCLQKVEHVGLKLRIHGTAFFEKEELKEFLKLSERWEHSSHVALGKKMELFEEGEFGEWLWFPDGQKSRSLLKKRIEAEEELQGFSRVSSLPISEDVSLGAFSESHQKFFERQDLARVFKFSECATFCSSEVNDSMAGLVDSFLCQGIRSHVFCQKKDLLDELISCLHFMTKIFKILGFAFRPVLFEVSKGEFKEVSSLFFKALRAFLEGSQMEVELAFDGVPRIEWSVEDGLGRSWPVACISAVLPFEEGVVSFASSCCLSFERVIALLLEKEEGYLPFWLSSVQIKVVPLQKKHNALAKETLAFLRNEGFRVDLCSDGGELKTLLRQALESGVPYVVVIGDKELETNTITLRDVRAKQAQSLPLQELIEVLKKVN